jgi:hypothetical protein
MTLKRSIFISIISVAFFLNSAAQNSGTSEVEGHSHTHHYHDHAHDTHKFHIGIGAAATYLNKEGHLAPGFHLHFIRQLGHHRQWGLGLGYEAIADEHWHNGLNLLVNYRPLSYLSLIAGPGMVFGKHDGETEILPGFHTEAVFEFNLRGLHVGPMIGYGLDKEDSHFSIGLHIGIGF